LVLRFLNGSIQQKRMREDTALRPVNEDRLGEFNQWWDEATVEFGNQYEE